MTQHSRDTPQFYLTAPSPCPYLPGRHERKVFTHLVGDKAGDLNDLLTHGGFRRSQSIAYRPACDQCRACVSVRVVANEFRPSRNFRKIMARNADIVGEQRSAVPTSEQYSIFRAYLDQRHRHGGMADMTVLDYAMMVEDSHVETRIIEYRRRGVDTAINGRGNELVAVALTDVLSDGLSMVYSFFEPFEENRSLGTFMILDHINRARRQGLPYVYLGYWIEGSKKMDYKGRFLPQQRLAPSGWIRIDASAAVFDDAGFDVAVFHHHGVIQHGHVGHAAMPVPLVQIGAEDRILLRGRHRAALLADDVGVAGHDFPEIPRGPEFVGDHADGDAGAALVAGRPIGNRLAAPEAAMGQQVVEVAGLFAHQMREHLALVPPRQIGARRGRRQVELRGITRMLGHGMSSVSERRSVPEAEAASRRQA